MAPDRLTRSFGGYAAAHHLDEVPFLATRLERLTRAAAEPAGLAALLDVRGAQLVVTSWPASW